MANRSHQDAAESTTVVEVSAATPEPGRRNVLVSLLALAVGGFITLVPAAAGLFVFLDPVIKKRAKGEAPGNFRRLCMLDAIPADGSPVKVAYIADRVDAWTVDPSQPLGAVYLRRTGKTIGKGAGAVTDVQAFNAICPHAGCFVAWLPQDKVYLCPCHNSAFLPDGEKTNFKGKTNPSPRAMDSLEVEVREGGEVWVDFHNYVVAQHEKEIKS